MREEWVRALRDRCLEKDVAFFFKQRGGRTSKTGGRELDGREWSEMPMPRTPAFA
jgi:protein gp37